MTLRWYSDGHDPVARIDVCPAPGCGAVREWHFKQYPNHLETHGPEDFGLAPIGEVRA